MCTATDSLPLLFPLIPSILSVGVAIYAVRVAMRQSRLAAEKLRLDFFDRRFQNWESINTATLARLDYLASVTPDGYRLGHYNNTGMAGFMDAKRQAQYLSGPEVLVQIKFIEDTMTAYLSARVDAAHVMDSPPERRVTALEAPGRTYIMRPGWWDRQRVKFRWFKQ